MKRIGVTGAFGFLGANFVSALLEASREAAFAPEGLMVRAFASSSRGNPLFDESEVEVRELDILEPRLLAREFRGLDAVAHFAGQVDYGPSSKRSVWETNAIGAKRVFDAVLEAGVPRLLYVSSVCVLGSSPPALLAGESGSPYGDPRWPISFASPSEALAAIEASLAGDYGFMRRDAVTYMDAKLAAWELAQVYARERGLPIVTVFPGTVVGAGDLHRSISRLVDDVWDGRLRFSFRGSTSFVASRDFARGALLALAKGRLGEGYILGGRDEHNLGYAEFQDLIASLARREGGQAHRGALVLPRPILLGMARSLEIIAPEAKFNAAFVLSGSLRNVCSSAKARAELGYEPSLDLEDAILECRRFSETLRARSGPARHPSPFFQPSA
jgi:dihydroflavonol-4-reductase